jgi:hypothetical protein
MRKTLNKIQTIAVVDMYHENAQVNGWGGGYSSSADNNNCWYKHN